MMKRVVWMAVGCVACLVCGAREVVFSDDFATRTSMGAVPENRWLTFAYTASDTGDPLCHNYIVKKGDKFDRNWPYPEDSSADCYQDYWGRAFMDEVNNLNPPGFANAYASPGNACAVFRSSDKKSATAVQPFWNEFTNGVLRFEVDIRRPAVWGGTAETYACRVLPVYKKNLNLNWGVGVNSTDYPVMFGASIDDSDKTTNRLVILYKDRYKGNNATLPVGKSGTGYVCNENWYRWRVYVNLDEQRCTACIWDAGPEQPDGRNDKDDSTATRTVASDIYGFRSPMTAKTGGIAGIAFNTYRSNSGTGSNFNIANAPCFDNVYLAWKAPGSSEYVSFYENDFTTRRVRRIEPAGAATCAYPVALETSTEDNYTVYPTTTNREDVSSGNLTQIVIQGDNRKPEPVGIDNWRRLAGKNRASVIDSDTAQGGKMLRIFRGVDHLGVYAQTLGESVTSGKVRVSGDVRLPLAWGSGSSARVALILGDSAFWKTCDKDNFTSHYIGQAGIVGEDNQPDGFYPAFLPPQPASMNSTMQKDLPCAATNWYRIVLTADFDRQTYNYELHKLGTGAGKWNRTDVGEAVFSTNNVPFRNPLGDLGSFGFSTYCTGNGNKWRDYVLWDNFRVWKNWGAADEKEIYRNDFDTRVWFIDRERTSLLGDVNRDDGLGGWRRRVKGYGYAWLTGEANRRLSLKTPNKECAYAASPLGTVLQPGKRVRVRADIRPPAEWSFADSTYSRCTVYLGGDEMLQYATCMNHLSDSVLAFGVGGKDKSLSRFTNSFFRVQNGDTLADTGVNVPDSSHWYRFEGRTVVGGDTWSCRIYDMGAAQPEIDTPNGKLLVAQDGLKRRCGADTLPTSVLITSAGVTSRDPWDPDDPARVFIDNIVVTQDDGGTTIIVR